MKFFSRGARRFVGALISTAALLSALPAPAQSKLGYDNFIDGGFSRFGANTNLAALSTNNAGMAWRLVTTNQVRVPQNSVLVVGGRLRGLTSSASNAVFHFSGSRNGVRWTTNVFSVSVPATGFATNDFMVPVATNLPYLLICWDRTDNLDAAAYTNDSLYYIWFPSRLRD